MDPRFFHHNTHLIDPKEFEERDPQLRYVKKQPYVFHSKLILDFPIDTPGIYTLSGGRQIGKTTLLKQWMLYLLKKKINPKAIAFLSGELISDHFTLMHLLQQQLESMPKNQTTYVILDEVNYIKDWDKTIKYAADAGLLEHTELFLTGSDMGFIKEARMRFPGRRGKAARDFHLYPLSFRETVFLKQHLKPDADVSLKILYEEFEAYLVHGGFLTAMNDLAESKTISPSTLTTYSDWIRGDMLKRGKHEHYLREIVSAILKRYNSQITWNSLAKDQAIDHPNTVYDYIALMEELDAVFVQQALVEDKLTGAPKKARKVYFSDPFIYHALYAWIYPEMEPYKNQIQRHLHDPIIASSWVEGCAVTHYRRWFPTYFIKGSDGEVDIAYIHDQKFWPVEIKWTKQTHAKDLKQLLKYKNSLLLTKRQEPSHEGIPAIPLPVALFNLDRFGR